MRKFTLRSIRFGVAAAALMSVLGMTSAAMAGGEAGPIALRDQGYFYVGVRPKPTEGGTAIFGQMYVGFQFPQEKKHPYPLLLVHGGGGQVTDWMGTPDGRDGWLDYFLAAGFDVYFVDRPGFGRSPNSTLYGELAAPATVEALYERFIDPSERYPGNGAVDDPILRDRIATSNPGPSVDNAVLKENLAELLDRIGPAILVTHSAGGPSGWLALDAKPDLVKGILAIETAGDFAEALAPLLTWEPKLEGEKVPTVELAAEKEGLDACKLQPEGKVHALPAFKDKPVLGIVSPNSPPFTPNFHCRINFLKQAGANAELVRLEDRGITGNGHFMNDELNNDVIAKEVFIPWLASIK